MSYARSRLEPPFLTCYRRFSHGFRAGSARRGQGQSEHVDSKELPKALWTSEEKLSFEVPLRNLLGAAKLLGIHPNGSHETGKAVAFFILFQCYSQGPLHKWILNGS